MSSEKIPIYEFFCGTGIISIFLTIPQFELLPVIFYEHYFLFSSLSLILSLLGYYNVIWKKQTFNNKVIKYFNRKKIIGVSIIISIYIFVISICFYEFEIKITNHPAPRYINNPF